MRSYPNNTDVVVDLAYDNPMPFNQGGKDVTDARYNRDALAITDGFNVGLDWMSLVVEAPPVLDEKAPDVIASVSAMKSFSKTGMPS